MRMCSPTVSRDVRSVNRRPTAEHSEGLSGKQALHSRADQRVSGLLRPATERLLIDRASFRRVGGWRGADEVHRSVSVPARRFNVRRYPNGKLLIKPSEGAVKRVRNRLAAELKALHGANAQAVIITLNPIIRGWAAYYRTVVSKEIFSSLDHYVWQLTWR